MQQNQQLKCLEALILELGGADSVNQSGARRGLLEHLQAARRSLLGSMPAEYSLSLQEAKASLGCISDKTARAKTKITLRNLIDPLVAA